MSRAQVQVIAANVPHVAIPFALDAPWYVLVEIVDTLASADLDGLLEEVLSRALEANLISDALVAASEAQAAAFWAIRHSVSEGSKRAGYVISHDSSVPIQHQAAFVRRVEQRIAVIAPQAIVVMHGHIGDGNLHVLAILPGVGPEQREAVAPLAKAISEAVDDETAVLGGSISAEHGIGLANRARLARVTPPAELDLLRRVKAMLDPTDMMNPGKVLPG